MERLGLSVGDVMLVALRRKLGSWASHIETVRGIGYRMDR